MVTYSEYGISVDRLISNGVQQIPLRFPDRPVGGPVRTSRQVWLRLLSQLGFETLAKLPTHGLDRAAHLLSAGDALA